MDSMDSMSEKLEISDGPSRVLSWMKSRRGEILISNCCRSVGERKWKEEGEVFTLKVRFDRTALFYCKLRKQSVKDSWIKSSPH